jgi:nucleoside-diphosphate-sugar epimerase
MIAIIGKSVLGKELYHYLSKNFKVSMFSRTDGIEYERETFKKILKNKKTVIWASGSYKDNEKELTKPIEELLNAIDKQKLIFTSSISVYGKNAKYVDENAKLNPDTTYAKGKAKSEKMINESYKNNVCLRLGVLYSHKYKHYKYMFNLIKNGIAPYFGNGNNNVPFTYLNDVLPCYKNAIIKNNNGIFNISGKGCKQVDAIKITAKAMRKNVLLIRLPKFIGKICDIAGCFLKTEAIESISADRLIISERAKSILKFKETPIDKGIKKEVHLWMKEKK